MKTINGGKPSGPQVTRGPSRQLADIPVTGGAFPKRSLPERAKAVRSLSRPQDINDVVAWITKNYSESK